MLDWGKLLEGANNVGLFVTLGIFLVIDIAMLTVGTLTLDECPIDLLIPIYLVIGGSTGIAGKIIVAVNHKLHYRFLRIITTICNTATTVCIIAGSVHVYRIYKPIFNKDLLPCCYCSKDAYWLVFVLGTLLWILTAISVLFLVCALFYWIYFKLKNKSSSNQLIEDANAQ